MSVPLWVPNRKRPRLWCIVVHWWIQRGWFSNDFGYWHVSGRKSFEVECQICGDCWSEDAL